MCHVHTTMSSRSTAPIALLRGLILVIFFGMCVPALEDESMQTDGGTDEPNPTSVPPTRPLLSHMWWNHMDEMDLGSPERLFRSEVRGMHECSKRLKDRMVVTMGPSPHAFVRYSAYRYSATSFFVNGLVTNTSGVPIRSCSWIELDGGLDPEWKGKNSSQFESVSGSAFYSTHTEPKSPLYNTILVGCRFSSSVQVLRGGGFLLLNWKGDGVDSSILVLHELPPHCTPQPKGVYKNGDVEVDIAFCGAPIFSGVKAYLLDEWFQYHWAISERGAHFFVYIGREVSPELDVVLNKFMDVRAMTVEDTRWVRQLGSSYYGGQAMALHDCQQRVLGDFKWVMNNDYDEYILFVSPQESLPSFLNARSKYSHISFGNVLFSLEACEDPPYENGSYVPWVVERMVYKQQGPYCGTSRKHSRNVAVDPNLCNKSRGRRKYAARPESIVGFATPHEILEVYGFSTLRRHDLEAEQTLVVDARHAFVAHFQHLLRGHRLCKTNITSFLATSRSVYQYPQKSGLSTKSWLKDSNMREQCHLMHMFGLLR